MDIKLVRGDGKTIRIPAVYDRATYTTASAEQAIFTVKRNLSDPDNSAIFQKALGAGLTAVSPSFFDVEVVSEDTEEVLDTDTTLYYDIQVQEDDGAPKTVALGKVFVTVDVTRGVQTAVPVYTSQPPLGAVSPTITAYANSTGNTTITFPAGSFIHTANVAVTGSAGTRIFILDIEDAVDDALGDGCLLGINFILPATASIVIEIRNATAGGTLLATLTTDGSGANLALDIAIQTGAWVEASISYIYPSN